MNRPGSGRTLKALRQYFLTGLFALLPVVITVYIGYRIVLFFNGVSGFLPARFQYPGLGLVLSLVFITLFGLLVSNFLGQEFVKVLEWIFARVPIVRSIYEGSKQILKTFFDQEGGGAFKAVVFVPYPHPGARSIGFIVNEGVRDGTIGVFVPFSPPTAGFLLFFEEAAIERTDLSVDEGMKLLLSGGTLTPRPRAFPEGSEVPSE